MIGKPNVRMYAEGYQLQQQQQQVDCNSFLRCRVLTTHISRTPSRPHSLTHSRTHSLTSASNVMPSKHSPRVVGSGLVVASTVVV